MPFKSEAQRRYLWANEPEIARDWTDTYGSRIKKNEGGIIQGGVENYLGKQPEVQAPRKWQSGPDKPPTELAYITEAEKDLILKADIHGSLSKGPNMGPSGIMSLDSWGDIGGAGAAGVDTKASGEAKGGNTYHGPTQSGPGGIHKKMSPADVKAEQIRLSTMTDTQHKDVEDKIKLEKKRQKGIIPSLWGMGIEAAKKFKTWNNAMQRKNFKKWYESRNPHPMGFVWDDWTEEDWSGKDIDEIPGYREYLNRFQQPSDGGGGQQPLWMQQGYPSYEAWLAAQGQGGTIVAKEVVEEKSPFQQSLNTGIAQGISPYYVGANPTAANIAWGQQFGVDPRTMYRAEGGPIRQRYFLGNIVKKIGRAAKKVIKSPIGLGIGALTLAPMAMGQWQGNTGFFGKRLKDMWLGKLGTAPVPGERMGGLWNWMKKNPWKAGIGAATIAPFLMGSEEDKEEDKAFDYDAAKQAYLNEIMKIKKDAMAGTLDPSQFVYQGIGPDYKDGGRIGYNEGGSEDPMLVEEYKKYIFEMEEMGLQPMSFEEFKRQALAGMASGGRAGYYQGGLSIPSENSLEDARKTAMQDRLGGITDVMKQADLYRQGDVGQMYMNQGGRIGAQEGGLMDLGGMEKDYRNEGGFVPIGKKEKADDVPARLSVNEFVFTADAVRNAGGGDVDKGAEIMENVMNHLEAGGKMSEESQGLSGAREMFRVSERLSEVV